MNVESIQPLHCYARATRMLRELELIRHELGRSEDARALPEVTNAQPRECYFEALAVWHKVDRLAGELGVRTSQVAIEAPSPRDARPGHVLQLIDAALAQLDEIKVRLMIQERTAEPPHEPSRQPSDVLVTLVSCGRQLSRMLERPFTPADVYRTVALASAYATRLGGRAPGAPFERGKRPADCYAQLEHCLAHATALIAKRGQPALATRGAPADVLPGDVYDLANLVLGELAYLHALAGAPPVHAFEPAATGYRLPAHVHQLARTLDAQLAAITST